MTVLVKIAANNTKTIIDTTPPVSDSYYGYSPYLKAAGCEKKSQAFITYFTVFLTICPMFILLSKPNLIYYDVQIFMRCKTWNSNFLNLIQTFLFSENFWNVRLPEKQIIYSNPMPYF